MPYTTQGYMTPEDMADLAYQMDLGLQDQDPEDRCPGVPHRGHTDPLGECPLYPEGQDPHVP